MRSEATTGKGVVVRLGVDGMFAAFKVGFASLRSDLIVTLTTPRVGSLKPPRE